MIRVAERKGMIILERTSEEECTLKLARGIVETATQNTKEEATETLKRIEQLVKEGKSEEADCELEELWIMVEMD